MADKYQIDDRYTFCQIACDGNAPCECEENANKAREACVEGGGTNCTSTWNSERNVCLSRRNTAVSRNENEVVIPAILAAESDFADCQRSEDVLYNSCVNDANVAYRSAIGRIAAVDRFDCLGEPYPPTTYIPPPSQAYCGHGCDSWGNGFYPTLYCHELGDCLAQNEATYNCNVNNAELSYNYFTAYETDRLDKYTTWYIGQYNCLVDNYNTMIDALEECWDNKSNKWRICVSDFLTEFTNIHVAALNFQEGECNSDYSGCDVDCASREKEDTYAELLTYHDDLASCAAEFNTSVASNLKELFAQQTHAIREFKIARRTCEYEHAISGHTIDYLYSLEQAEQHKLETDGHAYAAMLACDNWITLGAAIRALADVYYDSRIADSTICSTRAGRVHASDLANRICRREIREDLYDSLPFSTFANYRSNTHDTDSTTGWELEATLDGFRPTNWSNDCLSSPAIETPCILNNTYSPGCLISPLSTRLNNRYILSRVTGPYELSYRNCVDSAKKTNNYEIKTYEADKRDCTSSCQEPLLNAVYCGSEGFSDCVDQTLEDYEFSKNDCEDELISCQYNAAETRFNTGEQLLNEDTYFNCSKDQALQEDTIDDNYQDCRLEVTIAGCDRKCYADWDRAYLQSLADLEDCELPCWDMGGSDDPDDDPMMQCLTVCSNIYNAAMQSINEAQRQCLEESDNKTDGLRLICESDRTDALALANSVATTCFANSAATWNTSCSNISDIYTSAIDDCTTDYGRGGVEGTGCLGAAFDDYEDDLEECCDDHDICNCSASKFRCDQSIVYQKE